MKEPDFDSLPPGFAWMRDYLARVAPPGKLPGYQHIDLLALGELMPMVNLVDVVQTGTGLRFRFRHVGTAQTRKAGRMIIGKFVEEAVIPEFVERILNNMRSTVDGRVPVYDRFSMPHPGQHEIDSERVYFPLAADGENVSMLLILNNYPSVP